MATLPDLIQGNGRSLSLSISRNPLDPNSWIGSEVFFFLAEQLPASANPLLTLSRVAGQIAIATETASTITGSLVIPASATIGLNVPRMGRTLYCEIWAKPPGGEPFSLVGEIKLLPRVARLPQTVRPGAIAVVSTLGSPSAA